MSLGLVAIIFGIGAAGWIYSKTMNRTGGNTQSALITAGVSGAALALVFFLIMSMLT